MGGVSTWASFRGGRRVSIVQSYSEKTVYNGKDMGTEEVCRHFMEAMAKTLVRGF